VTSSSRPPVSAQGWAELKEAFWTALQAEPSERARHVAALAAIDPELPARLEALLAADAGGDALGRIFELDPTPEERPAHIGVYDVVGLLGAGGMGEVYRARDARLQREVAIKVLPPALAADPERLARFEREARVLASLKHPHVAQIYGLEETSGVPALVMELVEGPTLAEVVARYPETRPPLLRVLRIAWQIADGLAAAHEKGIVHRDLKPGNVALTEDGDVKILDFGIAKSLGSSASTTGGAAGDTEAGKLLGTPAYMSPEQARGLTIDRRADIWAFGCVLYELLTGLGPFAGTTPSDSLAAVLEHEPDLGLLPPQTPAAVHSLLRHCLEKEPSRRLRDIADARLALEDALQAPNESWSRPGDVSSRSQDLADPLRSGRTARRAIPWMLMGAGAAAVAVLAASWLADGRTSSEEAGRIVTSLVLPRDVRLTGSGPAGMFSESRFAISPDGRRLVFVAADSSGRPRLWLRELQSAVFQPLAETEDASFPFWSPDSESIGFVADGKLKTITIYGGEPVTVSDAGFRSASWSRDDLILFSPGGRTPLYAVPASGGAPVQVTTLDTARGEVQHSDPSFLPDGRHFLYFAYGSLSGGALDPGGVFVSSLDGSTSARLLLAGASQARYATGHLLFVQGGTLMAQPFDVGRLALHGTPSPLVEDVRLSHAGATGATAGYSVSEVGVLAYQAALRTESRLVWLDRDGSQVGAVAAAADYGDVALSPDGLRLAVSVLDPTRATRDLWLYGSNGGPGQRLTSQPGDEFAPVWSPDGRRLLFSATRKGLVDLFLGDPGSISAELSPIEADTFRQGRFASDWSRDDRYLAYIGGGRAIATSDLWVAPVENPRHARPFVNSPFVETHGRIAPTGDWLLYTSNETSRMEVYADRFPDGGAKRIVSTEGGGWPRWSPDGTEIYYLSPDNALMAAAVRTTPERLDVSVPRRLFEVQPRPPVRLDAYAYDVAPGGRRFLVNTLVEDPTSTVITLVLNWTANATRRHSPTAPASTAP
jgi:serine/threonine protein kinase